MGEPDWTVVVPVKRLSVAKSRLRGALPGVPHEMFALALARDTVRAALACPVVARLTVVTDDAEVVRVARAEGAQVVADPGGGLNAACAAGADRAGGGWVAALAADLPALRPAELADALHAASGGGPARHFVADAPGTGTVLLATAPGTPLGPRFGGGSAVAHAESGAVALTGDWPTLRRDVDTAADLAEAAVLGLGPHSGALVGALRAATDH
ncbi:2-phospho-L-lactate guanylyltransferase [Micromonospora sp. CPCC 206060]|uniref:2-phospho-L-lactate guanylyltransferase n=1 Tax=Micromonospora sp. CPCC 206060 TaxID=3122406 RepID=UPI002FF2E2A6